MNYIYDIVVNFNDQFYDFFEWNNKDQTTHVRKIPVYKINHFEFLDFRNYQVKVKTEFLAKIKNRTELFHHKNMTVIRFACLLTDGEDVIGLQFNESGLSIRKTDLLIDESLDVIDLSRHLKELAILYEVIKKEKKDSFHTRQEQERQVYLKKEFQQLIQKQEYEKIKYLYYECFNKQEDQLELIIGSVIDHIQNGNKSIIDKMYHFFQLLSIQK